jgi:elongator complex protein 3
MLNDVSSTAVQSDEIKTFILWKSPDTTSYRNFVSLDTRSREVRNKKEKTKELNLVIRKYLSSVWEEYFISYEDELGYLYWFTRLLHPKEEFRLDIPWLWKTTALIRELHVYWALQGLEKDQEENNKVQHTWLWKNLLDIAEKLSKQLNFENLSVISWVGVREYYRKQGYQLEWTYMLKKL